MRILVIDPFAGISGDMFLGALLDLGLEEAWLRDTVAGAGLGPVDVRVERVGRQGIACRRVHFEAPEEGGHRHLPEILEILERSPVPQKARTRAAAAFRRLADAEGAVHGVPPEKVHFHEVGATDAILDILCGCAGLEPLGVEACFTRPVALGRGWVDAAHGPLPVPAPATLRLLEGLAVRETPFEGECTTPTGAALLATLTEGRPPPSDLRLSSSGYGAGARDPADRPNCVRLLLAETVTGAESLVLVQADLDDMPPEYLAAAQEALLGAGAADAVVMPLGMKKGRPGFRVEALVSEAGLDGVLGTLFRSTTTIGARWWRVERPSLPREELVREWRGQRIRSKRVRLPDGTARVKPEYEDVARAAAALDLTPLEVRRALEDRGAGAE